MMRRKPTEAGHRCPKNPSRASRRGRVGGRRLQLLERARARAAGHVPAGGHTRAPARSGGGPLPAAMTWSTFHHGLVWGRKGRCADTAGCWNKPPRLVATTGGGGGGGGSAGGNNSGSCTCTRTPRSSCGTTAAAVAAAAAAAEYSAAAAQQAQRTAKVPPRLLRRHGQQQNTAQRQQNVAQAKYKPLTTEVPPRLLHRHGQQLAQEGLAAHVLPAALRGDGVALDVVLLRAGDGWRGRMGVTSWGGLSCVQHSARGAPRARPASVPLLPLPADCRHPPPPERHPPHQPLHERGVELAKVEQQRLGSAAGRGGRRVGGGSQQQRSDPLACPTRLQLRRRCFTWLRCPTDPRRAAHRSVSSPRRRSRLTSRSAVSSGLRCLRAAAREREARTKHGICLLQNV